MLRGPSTEAKPTDVPVGTVFMETDTGNVRVWKVSEGVLAWHDQHIHRDTADNKIDHQMLRAPIVVITSAIPGFGVANAIMVPTSSRLRFVHVGATVNGTKVLTAWVSPMVETSPSSGVYLPAGRITTDLGTILSQNGNLYFPVPGGCRYYFDRSGQANTTETITTYGFTDLVN